MRLSLSINGVHSATASLEQIGWLGAHVSLSEGMEDTQPVNRVWLTSSDTSQEPNTIHSTWESVPLSIGDKVQIEVLPDGQSDLPIEVIRTSESPANLFSSIEHARSLLRAVKVCDNALAEISDKVAEQESPEEMQKIRVAIGSVVVEIDQQLISPTLRRHPELLTLAEELELR